MKKKKLILMALFIVGIVLIGTAGCAKPTTEGDTDSLVAAVPVSEHYEYTRKERSCYIPAFTNKNEKAESLSVYAEGNSYLCMTTDESLADSFINAQRTLLHFLQNNGVTLRELNYIAVNFDDSFSDSEKNTAYISLSSIKTQRQVLVTLQAIWGDFVDYGYVYAMSNAIAAHLSWETEEKSDTDSSAADAFFCENTDALNLLYPAFTELYATEETVKYSKWLSLDLFLNVDLCATLKMPIEEQTKEFAKLICGYSEKINASFSPHSCDYAYRGAYQPLCIRSTYVTHVVDHGYKDYYEDIYDDYFGDYVTIYQTADIIDKETVDAVKRFGLEELVGNSCFNWLSEESALTKYAAPRVNMCYFASGEIYVTTISLYLHEFYHRIEYLINPDSAKYGSWQSQAFCEIGRSYSEHAHYAAEKTFSQDANWAELFSYLNGYDYSSDVKSYFESNDVLCYALNEYSFDYNGGGPSINSLTYYLIKQYGEDAIFNLMLYPDTVVDLTGKTWDTLKSEWKQYIQDKYNGKELPSWLEQN